jgi:hypothetical protein
MIFPSKHVRLAESILGLSAFVLKFLQNPKNIDILWGEVKQIYNSSSFPANHSYDNFILAIDYLYLVGIINTNEKGEIFICS